MLTIEPSMPASTIDFAARWVARKVPTRLTSITEVNCSKEVSRKSHGMAMPAQFTRMESGPISASIRSNIETTCTASPMSQTIASVSPPSRLAASMTPASSMSARTIRAPFSAIASAQA